MRSQVARLAVLVAVLAAVAGGYGYWRWLNSPRYALQQMVIALKTRDLDRLLFYLDLPSIVSHLGREAAEDLAQVLPGSPEPDAVERFGRRVLEKLARAIPPKAVEGLIPLIKTGMEKYLHNLSNAQILGLAAAVSTARIEQRGERATVIFADPKTQEQFRFEMVRDPADGVWRIAALPYEDLKRLVKQEFK
ncbi:MAG: DUF2939 domain-containing protein [Syntrophobacterales bacterium]|nr:DUF2939 domain-containing protein [Syntrophobacterales bacterium]